MVSNILIADDSKVLTMFVENIVGSIKSCEPYVINDGSKILNILSDKEKTIDVVILDRMMGEVDGIDILKKMKKDKLLRNIPVILLTGMDIEKDIAAGIKAGAFQYLTKPIDYLKLIDAVENALIDYSNKRLILENFRKNRSTICTIRKGSFVYRTLEECNNLSILMATCFPDSESAIIGLNELMMNAIEHGNLEITYEEKKQLQKEGRLFDEIEKRLKLDKYKEKIVTVNYEYSVKGVVVTIKDQGNGFNWRQYLGNEVSNITDLSGRGILLAETMSFDKINYNNLGNEVTIKSYL